MFIREMRRHLSFRLRELRNNYYRFMGVKIGRNVFISRGAWIDTQDGEVIIEDNVRITNGCKILSHDYSLHTMGKPALKATTTIEKGAFVGMNAVLLPGVTVGEGSIVGAGCVVSEDVPAFSVLVGAKSRIVKQKNLETGLWESVLGADKSFN